MNADWKDINLVLPEDDQRVLGFIPGNKVYLPGKDLQFENREVVVLRFCKDFYAKTRRSAPNTVFTFGLEKATATTSLPM